MPDQLPLFGFRDMLGKRTKVPISKERIEEVKRLVAGGRGKDAAEKLREVRYKLENYCNRIRNA